MKKALRFARSLVPVLLFLLAAGACAQGQPVQSAPAIADTFAAVVPPRPIDEITRDRERAGLLLTQAKQRLSRAKEEITAVQSMISAREKDLDALKGYLKTLDSDSMAAEIAAMKEKVALLEKVLDLVELRKNVREGEAASARATVAYAEASEEFYSLEGALAKKRDDRASLAKDKARAADVASADEAIIAAQEKVMDQWKEMLSKQDDSVSEEQDFLKSLRKLAEAQDAFHPR